MIGKKTLRDYGYETIDEYFGYIVESRVNGQFSQAKDLIKRLSSEQYVSFVNYLNENDIKVDGCYIRG